MKNSKDPSLSFKKNQLPDPFPVTTSKVIRLSCRNPKTKIMKRIIFFALIITIGVSLYAQPAVIDRLYYNYKGEEGVVALKIPGFVMKLAGSIADLDREEKQLLQHSD